MKVRKPVQKKASRPAPKTYLPPIEPAEAPQIDDVGDLEEEMKEIELADLQRTLAATEARLENLNIELEERVKEKVNEALKSVGPFLVAAEFRIAEKLIQFFMQSPEWEMMKVTRADVGAGPFYNPADTFRSMLAKGWKWMGSHFDEDKKERYELFFRQKNMPKTLLAMMDLYKDFGKQANEPAKTILAKAKAEDTKRRTMLIKPTTKK